MKLDKELHSGEKKFFLYFIFFKNKSTLNLEGNKYLEEKKMLKNSFNKSKDENIFPQLNCKN